MSCSTVDACLIRAWQLRQTRTLRRYPSALLMPQQLSPAAACLHPCKPPAQARHCDLEQQLTLGPGACAIVQYRGREGRRPRWQSSALHVSTVLVQLNMGCSRTASCSSVLRVWQAVLQENGADAGEYQVSRIDDAVTVAVLAEAFFGAPCTPAAQRIFHASVCLLQRIARRKDAPGRQGR